MEGRVEGNVCVGVWVEGWGWGEGGVDRIVVWIVDSRDDVHGGACAYVWWGWIGDDGVGSDVGSVVVEMFDRGKKFWWLGLGSRLVCTHGLTDVFWATSACHWGTGGIGQSKEWRAGKRAGSMFRDVECCLRLNSRCANTTRTLSAARDGGETSRRASSIRGSIGATHWSFPVAESAVCRDGPRQDAVCSQSKHRP